MKALYASYLLVKEISNRKHIELSEIMHYWPWEVEELLKNSTKANQKGRKKAVTVYARNDDPKFYYGKKAISVRKSEFQRIDVKLTNFSGLVVSLGKSSGIAKLAVTAAEAARKVNKGDILVTSMTTPEFIQAMKKAAAIVTDEGGITCHAAIISRELKIPCIVGTKIATKVINDNDIVEVNANHGFVKV